MTNAKFQNKYLSRSLKRSISLLLFSTQSLGIGLRYSSGRVKCTMLYFLSNLKSTRLSAYILKPEIWVRKISVGHLV